MTNKRTRCQAHNCNNCAEIMGYCGKHYEEHAADARLQDDAVRMLHSGSLDGRNPATADLKAKLTDAQKWWRIACDTLIRGSPDTVLSDEAPFASEWCISLAKEIIVADRALQKGVPASDSLEYTYSWVHDRFSNLEAGRKSDETMRSAT